MKRWIMLFIAIAIGLLITARPAASDKPPTGGGPPAATVAPAPTDSPLPTPAPTVTPFISPLPTPRALAPRIAKEKPDRAEPIWLMYWRWMVVH